MLVMPNLSKPTDIRLNIMADLQKWRAFLAIAELGSLTRAALFLDTNQSFLSRQINALERDCGTRLFNRTGRGVELSEVGARLFPQVTSLLADAERLELEIRESAQEPSGVVTIATLPSIGFHLIGPLYSALKQTASRIQLKVLEGSSGQVEEWLADARIDIAIVYRYGPPRPAEEHCLATIDSYLIGPPGDVITAAAEVDFLKLHALPFILPSAPNGLRTMLDSLAKQWHIHLEPLIEADSLPLQKSLVEKDKLYTVLPLHAVWTEVSEGRLQASRIVNPICQRKIALTYAKSKRLTRAVSRVSSLIQVNVENMGRNGLWHSVQTGELEPPGSSDATVTLARQCGVSGSLQAGR